MKKWIPTSIGCVAGIIVGMIYLFQPVESMPTVIAIPVHDLSSLIRQVFMPNTDPMAVFAIQIPVIVLLSASVGTLAGFLLGVVLSITRKYTRPNKGTGR